MNWMSEITVTRDEGFQVALILGGAVGLGLALAILISRIFTLPSTKDRPWARALKGPLRSLAFWGLLLGGINLAIDGIESMAENIKFQRFANSALSLALAIYLTYCGVKFIIAFYKIEVARTDLSQPERINRLLIFRKLTTGLVLAIGFLFILQILGVNTQPFLAGGAFSGVVIGLAFQESLSNVFSGILFAWDASIRIGDLIRLSNEKEGYVENIGWRTTTLRTPDHTLLVLPNSVLSKDTIVNLSRPKPLVTIPVELKIQYGADLQKVEDIALEVANEVQSEHHRDGVHLDEPRVRWKDFTDQGIIVRVLLPIALADGQVHTKSKLIRSLHDRFAQEGILLVGQPVPSAAMIEG